MNIFDKSQSFEMEHQRFIKFDHDVGVHNICETDPKLAWE